MTKEQKRSVVEGYLAAEKPYEVCAHTTMGSYMEFIRIECGIMFEDNARMVADTYAAAFKQPGSVKSVCVRKGYEIVYEVPTAAFTISGGHV